MFVAGESACSPRTSPPSVRGGLGFYFLIGFEALRLFVHVQVVAVEIDGKPFDTGLRKFGALLADSAEIGCNSVLNPGSIIGRGAVIYPNTNWRGVLAPNMIAKNKAAQQIVSRRPV